MVHGYRVVTLCSIGLLIIAAAIVAVTVRSTLTSTQEG
jgi:hypothetical protein